MAWAGSQKRSDRLSWRNYPLTYAFLVSLALHALLVGAAALGLFDRLAQPPAKVELVDSANESKKDETRQKPELRFVEVPPEAAVKEAPEDAEYYSSESSRAANPDPPEQDADRPKLEGEQDKVIQTRNVVKTKSVPGRQAAKNPARETKQTQAETQDPQQASKRPEEMNQDHQASAPPEMPDLDPGLGDLAMARQQRDMHSETMSAARRLPAESSPSSSDDRPRTLEEARARQGAIEGRRSRQDGGVRREGSAALDVKATTYGAYDKAMVAAIQQHWYNLLGDHRYAADTHGRVVVSFRLHQDGRVTQAEVVESSVSTVLSMLCRQAIEAPAPYGEWPREMAQTIGKSHRDLRFTFYYN